MKKEEKTYLQNCLLSINLTVVQHLDTCVLDRWGDEFIELCYVFV